MKNIVENNKFIGKMYGKMTKFDGHPCWCISPIVIWILQLKIDGFLPSNAGRVPLNPMSGHPFPQWLLVGNPLFPDPSCCHGPTRHLAVQESLRDLQWQVHSTSSSAILLDKKIGCGWKFSGQQNWLQCLLTQSWKRSSLRQAMVKT